MNTTSGASQLMGIVGPELMDEICNALGGQTIYIPCRSPDFARDNRVCAEFNEVIHEAPSVGSAYARVAAIEDVSPRTVQRIISLNW